MNGFSEGAEQRAARVREAKARCGELEADLRKISSAKAEIAASLDPLRASHGLAAVPSKRGPARKTSREPPRLRADVGPAARRRLPVAAGCSCCCKPGLTEPPCAVAGAPSKRQRVDSERDKRINAIWGQCLTIYKQISQNKQVRRGARARWSRSPGR